MLEEAGLRIVASRRIQMTKEQAEGFYAVKKERPFFNDLVSFMISGPVVGPVLEGEVAVKPKREVWGAPNPADAAEGPHRTTFTTYTDTTSDKAYHTNKNHPKQNPP